MPETKGIPDEEELREMTINCRMLIAAEDKVSLGFGDAKTTYVRLLTRNSSAWIAFSDDTDFQEDVIFKHLRCVRDRTAAAKDARIQEIETQLAEARKLIELLFAARSFLYGGERMQINF